MKLTKEKFNKLNQLDRIEYRQKKEAIQGFFSSGFLEMSLIVSTFFLVVYSYLKLYFPTIDIISKTSSVAIVSNLTILIIFCFIFDLIFSRIGSHQVSKLNKEYFTVEVKSKKK